MKIIKGRGKGFSIFVRMLGISLAFLAIASVANADTLTVHPTDSTADYTTIQGAVDVASDGDSIEVWNSTYSEGVRITDLSDLWIYSRDGASVTVVNGSLSEYVFNVTGSNITIEGFTIRDRKLGIYLNGADECSILNNRITNNSEFGIYLNSSAKENLIRNNKMNSNGGTGLYMNKYCNNNTIERNEMNSNKGGLYMFQNCSNNNIFRNEMNLSSFGLYMIADCNNNTIERNEMKSNLQGLAIYGCNGNTIEKNKIISNTFGLFMIGCNGSTIEGNDVNLNNEGFLLRGNATENTIINNTFNSNLGFGISLSSLFNSTLKNNTASENNYGFHLGSSKNNTLKNNNVKSNRLQGIVLINCSYNNITNNILELNEIGIDLNRSNNNNWVLYNFVILNTRYGIQMGESKNNNISCNFVAHNNVRGFYLKGGSVENNISCNNIIANGEYNATSGGYEWNFYNNQPDNVDTSNNYWGTTENSIINASIYDWNDNPGKGNVTYLPKLEEASPCAPIPELSTAILICVGLIALGTIVYRKRD